MAHEIVLSGVVGWDFTASSLRDEFAKAKGQDVEIHINTPGGLAFAGIEMYNIIKDYKGHTTAKITGIAASAGSYLVLAADKLVAFDNSAFMIHNAMSLAMGNHNDLRHTADYLEKLSNVLAKAYADKSGKSLSKTKALMDEETFFFGDEIKTEGFADEIVDNPDGDAEASMESVKTIALASIAECNARLRESGAANSDFERAVAYIDSTSLFDNTPGAKKTTAVATTGGGCET